MGNQEASDKQLRLMGWWVGREFDRELPVRLLVAGTWLDGTLVNGLSWFNAQTEAMEALGFEGDLLEVHLGEQGSGSGEGTGERDLLARPSEADLPWYLHLRLDDVPSAPQFVRLRVECVAAWTLA